MYKPKGNNWLNTAVLEASYILPALMQFSWPKFSKTREDDLPPHERDETGSNKSF